MSKKDIEQFMTNVKEDKELQEKLIAITKTKSVKDTGIEDIIVLAKEYGYDFTAQELNEAADNKKNELMVEKELDDKALEQVAGGTLDFGAGYLVLSIFTVMFGCEIAFMISATNPNDPEVCTRW